jgi:glycosyltransferase involved in cell wall biosynthesis
MRVLQIVDSLKYGGAEKLLVTFAQQAQERQIETTVLSLSDAAGAPLRLQLEAFGTQVIVLPRHSLFDLKKLQQISRIMRAGKFDIVHTHLTYSNIKGAVLARLNGLPVVATIHNTEVDSRHSHPLRDRLEILALRYLARHVIAVGASVADVYNPILHRQCDVIPNAVLPPVILTPAERAALRTELTGGEPLGPLCITVGRFSPQKGYLHLLDAFALVHAASPTAMLLIVGDGVMRPELEAKIAALDLGGCVRLLGLRNDVPRLLAAADLYINASLWEGLPIAHLEAMMAGLPVAVTAVGEVPRLVIEGTGLLVPAQKPDELATVILTLLADPARRVQMGSTAQTYVQQHYSAAVWFESLLQIYRKVTT